MGNEGFPGQPGRNGSKGSDGLPGWDGANADQSLAPFLFGQKGDKGIK